jgi:hypothetical protein
MCSRVSFGLERSYVNREAVTGLLKSLAVLFVADLFHPVNGLAVEELHDGDVRHGGDGRSAVPVFLTRRKPDNVLGMNRFNQAALALRAPAAGGDD